MSFFNLWFSRPLLILFHKEALQPSPHAALDIIVSEELITSYQVISIFFYLKIISEYSTTSITDHFIDYAQCVTFMHIINFQYFWFVVGISLSSLSTIFESLFCITCALFIYDSDLLPYSSILYLVLRRKNPNSSYLFHQCEAQPTHYTLYEAGSHQMHNRNKK